MKILLTCFWIDVSQYEPEIFPGLIYRMADPKIVLLVFVSGKIVLTGAKVREDIYSAFENIYPMLAQFRKRQQCWLAYKIFLFYAHCKGYTTFWVTNLTQLPAV
jgi:hypothetical protein